MNWREFVRHRYVGFAYRFALVLVLAFAVGQVADRKATLDTQGCYGYWSEYGGVESFESYEFLNKSEYRDLKEGFKHSAPRYKGVEVNESAVKSYGE